MDELNRTIVDLFAGAGGLSEGFCANGFDVVAHAEMDKDACDSLKTRVIFHYLNSIGKESDYYLYQKGLIELSELIEKYDLSSLVESVINVEINSDTYSTTLEKIRDLLAGRDLDGIIGGPPCQAYSNIGRSRDKKGMVGDKRNYLYKYYLSFLKDLTPNFFLFENVPGLLSAGKGVYLKKMLNGMRELGYEVPEPRVVNTADYNVPQNRKRVIVVGWKSGFSFDVESVFKKPKVIPFNVNDFLYDLPKMDAGESISFFNYETQNKVIKKLGMASIEGFTTENITRPHNSQDLEIYKIAVEKANNGEFLKYNELPTYLKTHKNEKSFLDRFKVIRSNQRASHTVVAHISKDGHYYIHPDIEQNRSLSVRESARLQTFPDDFKFEGSRTAIFKQIGNAVPPVFAKCLAENILEQVMTNNLKKTA